MVIFSTKSNIFEIKSFMFASMSISLHLKIQYKLFSYSYSERERWLFERESDLYLSFIYNRPFLHLCLFLCTYYIGHLLTCIQTRERKERRKKERQIEREREREIFRQTEYYCRKSPLFSFKPLNAIEIVHIHEYLYNFPRKVSVHYL